MQKRVELDVDFIGGELTPTKEEFLAISEYIKAANAKKKLGTQRKVTRSKPNSKLPR